MVVRKNDERQCVCIRRPNVMISANALIRDFTLTTAKHNEEKNMKKKRIMLPPVGWLSFSNDYRNRLNNTIDGAVHFQIIHLLCL